MFFSQLHDSSIFMEKCQAQEEEHKESIPVNKLHHRIFTHKKGSKVKRHVAYAYYCSDLNDFCVRILYVCVTQNVMRQRCIRRRRPIFVCDALLRFGERKGEVTFRYSFLV